MTFEKTTVGTAYKPFLILQSSIAANTHDTITWNPPLLPRVQMSQPQWFWGTLPARHSRICQLSGKEG